MFKPQYCQSWCSPRISTWTLLFVLYINDITDNLGNLARLFADDTSLSYFGRNYDIMKSDINNDLSKLNE
jgi:hypothetical protein